MTSDAFIYFFNTLQSHRTMGNSVAYISVCTRHLHRLLSLLRTAWFQSFVYFVLNPRPLLVQVVSADCVR